MSLVRALLVPTLLAACHQVDRLPPLAPFDPRRSVPEVVLGANALPQMSASTHADFDRLEQLLLPRFGPAGVFEIYGAAWSRLRGGRLGMMRWLELGIGRGVPEAERRQAEELIPALVEAKNFDADPDFAYLFGLVGWTRLVGGPEGGALQSLGSLKGSATADLVLKHWTGFDTRFPTWTGPRGITSATVGGRARALAESIARLDARPSESTPPAPPHGDAWEVAEELSRRYEDDPDRKAPCEKLDERIASVPDPVALGEVYAHCQLDRKNPEGAVAQLRAMARRRIPGGLGSLVVRLRAAARADDALQDAVRLLESELRDVAKSDPAFAARSGLTAIYSTATP